MGSSPSHEDAKAESSGVLAAIGLLLVAMGCLIILLGLLYCAAGWRYGAVVAIWAAEWGLPFAGVGSGLARFGRRGASAIAIGGGLGGLLLLLVGDVSGEYDSYAATAVIGAVAIVLGIASAIARRRAKVSSSNPEVQREGHARR